MIKILVVEDTLELLNSLMFAFKMEGFHAFGFSNATDALKQVAGIRPDIVLTDLSMPDMDGFTFIKAIRNSSLLKDMPIAIFSARPKEEFIDQAIELGVNNYIVKPCTIDDLVSEIKKTLNK